MNRRYLQGGTAAALVLAAVSAIVVLSWSFKGPASRSGGPLVEVAVPELPAQAIAGRDLFQANCAACHGDNAGGREGFGPPLVHKIYEPNHHGDGAFLMAAFQGVRAHHWPFGDMPPVPAVTNADVEKIVAYVRTLQKANGIF